MPVATSHEKTVSVARTPKSMGATAKLNKNSVGTPRLEELAAVFSNRWSLTEDMSVVKSNNPKLKQVERLVSLASTNILTLLHPEWGIASELAFVLRRFRGILMK